jgi:hypothetical protein
MAGPYSIFFTGQYVGHAIRNLDQGWTKKDHLLELRQFRKERFNSAINSLSQTNERIIKNQQFWLLHQTLAISTRRNSPDESMIKCFSYKGSSSIYGPKLVFLLIQR